MILFLLIAYAALFGSKEVSDFAYVGLAFLGLVEITIESAFLFNLIQGKSK